MRGFPESSFRRKKMGNKFEIVRFQHDNVVLDVSVSPSEETVWLRMEEMALLFGVKRPAIVKHVSNILSDGELDVSTCSVLEQVQTEGTRTIKRKIKIYNLDMVISVGYRVKSKNGIIFRKWANGVLKDYLLKGYVLDEKRTLITNDNYANLVHRVDDIDKRLSTFEEGTSPLKDRIFFDGEFFEARVFLKGLFSKAKKEIVLIDPYADILALDYLKEKNAYVETKLIISSKSKLTQNDIASFNAQFGNLSVSVNDAFHDRFLIIDGRLLYHIGASLNYVGKKVFGVGKIEDPVYLASLKGFVSFV